MPAADDMAVLKKLNLRLDTAKPGVLILNLWTCDDILHVSVEVWVVAGVSVRIQPVFRTIEPIGASLEKKMYWKFDKAYKSGHVII